MHYKISMLAYMLSYCAYFSLSSAQLPIMTCACNCRWYCEFVHNRGDQIHTLLLFEFPVGGLYETWLTTTELFFGSSHLGYTLVRYRLGERELFRGPV